MVFTDLDGTLLDYDGYRWAPAADALRLLAARRIPLIFCSSKTRAEQLVYQAAMGLREPFIVENGSALVIPAGYFGRDLASAIRELANVPDAPARVRVTAEHEIMELGLPGGVVRQRLVSIRDETGLPFRGYADMTVEEVSALTGLDREAAHRARLREYSETIHARLSAAQWQRLQNALASRGLGCPRGRAGGTVISAATDKGRAVSLLLPLLRRKHGELTTMGVGDSENDVAMLRAVDRPFLVQRRDGSWADVDVAGIQRVVGIGPVGWARAIRAVMTEES